MNRLHALLILALAGHKEDRGDIPGWVMIAIMSAAVAALGYRSRSGVRL